MILKEGMCVIYTNCTHDNLTRGVSYRIEEIRKGIGCIHFVIKDDIGTKRTFRKYGNEPLRDFEIPGASKEEEVPSIDGGKVFSAVHPEHYHHGGIDVFKYGEANLSHEAMSGFYRLNIIKYVTRYDRKGGLEDLEKAETYLRALWELEVNKNAEKS